MAEVGRRAALDDRAGATPGQPAAPLPSPGAARQVTGSATYFVGVGWGAPVGDGDALGVGVAVAPGEGLADGVAAGAGAGLDTA